MVRQVALRKDSQEVADSARFGVGFLHVPVVEAIALQNILVPAGERRVIHAPVVPRNHHPTAWLENASEFATCAFWFEPVERLPRGYEIHTRIIQRGGFGRRVNTGEPVIGGKIFFPGFAHLFVGFNPINAVAILQEQLAKKPCARTDISNYMAGPQSTFCTKKVKERGWIARPVAKIVRNAGGKALLCVSEGH